MVQPHHAAATQGSQAERNSELIQNKVYFNLGSGAELSSNISWPKVNNGSEEDNRSEEDNGDEKNNGNEDNNGNEGPSTVETSNENVTDDKSPVPTIDAPEKNMLDSPVKVSFIVFFTIEKHPFTQVVTFQVIEDLAPETSPSDSNNSAPEASE